MINWHLALPDSETKSRKRDETTNRPPPNAAIWWIIIAFAFALTVFLHIKPISNSDIFWHLAAGKLIVQTRSIPHTDPFSYTMEGREWVTHEWLFEAVTYLAYRIGGLNGLGIPTLAFLVSAIWFPVLLCRRAGLPVFWVFVCVIAGAIMLRSRSDWRPLIITTLFFSIYIYILEQFIERRSSSLWPLPLLAIIWANWHSGVVFGILLVGYYAICAYFSRPSKHEDSQTVAPWLKLAIVCVLCLGCALVNPNTIDALLYPIRLGGFYSQVLLSINVIEELQNLTFDRVPAFWFSLAICLVGAIASRRQLKFRHLIILLALIAASIYRSRFLEIYVPAFIAFAPQLIQRLTDRIGASPQRLLTLGVNTLVDVGAVALALCLFLGSLTGPPSLGLLEDFYPVASADWVEEFNPPGYMYNHIDNGGYLTHRLYPQRRVFWDGRLLVFRDIFRRLSEGETILDIHHIDFAVDVLSESGENPFSPEQWALVAFDQSNALYISRTGAAAYLIPEHEYFMLGPYLPEDALRNINDYADEMKQSLVVELERFLEENRTDFGRSFACGAYIMLGGEYMSRARELLAQGLSTRRCYLRYWHYSALYDYYTGNLERAEKTIRALLFWWPRSVEARYLLARISSAQGRHGRAAKLFRQAIAKGYTSPQAYFCLARELHALGKNAEAIEALNNYFSVLLPQDYETRECAEAVSLGRELTEK